jgi:hypothetical protein
MTVFLNNRSNNITTHIENAERVEQRGLGYIIIHFIKWTFKQPLIVSETAYRLSGTSDVPRYIQ